MAASLLFMRLMLVHGSPLFRLEAMAADTPDKALTAELYVSHQPWLLMRIDLA